MSTSLRPCVYCGSTTDLTRDHIPPKSLFNKPRPHLITVSACRGCNAGFSRDDDYFWLTLASRAEARNHDATEASARAIKNLSRQEAEGFRSILATVESVEVRTPAGLYVGDSLAYNVSFTRLNRVAARITKGLFGFRRRYDFHKLTRQRRGQLKGLRPKPTLTSSNLSNSLPRANFER